MRVLACVKVHKKQQRCECNLTLLDFTFIKCAVFRKIIFITDSGEKETVMLVWGWFGVGFGFVCLFFLRGGMFVCLFF